MTSSTQAMQPLCCVHCGRVLAYVNGDASVRCGYDKYITLSVNGVIKQGIDYTIINTKSYKKVFTSIK